jgi:signal transduction histidine kinase/putative methionine-R-sulfoxide reductase with GAF domain
MSGTNDLAHPPPAAPPDERALSGEGLAMLAQAMLALRSTGDLGTACAIAGACALSALEASDYRLLRLESRSGALMCLDGTGVEAPYLPEPDGPAEWAMRHEMAAFDEGLTEPNGLREAALWLEPPLALASIPLVSAGNLCGLLLVGFDAPRRFGSASRLFLQTLGDGLALALDRAELRRQLEDERKRVRVLEKRRAGDEESSSNLMSVVAHEIRSPLTAIKAYTEAMLDNLQNPHAPRERFLGIINDECDRLTRLVSDILDLSRLEAGQRPLRLARFDLERLVQEALEGLLPAARARKQRFETQLESGMVVEADPDLLRRLLVNLAGNAVKYSPPGGTIRVGASPEGDEWVGFVEDDGPGIPPEDLPHIFERFFRARNAQDEGEGTGLGLAIVRGIVELHGGRIWVQSIEPTGTRFCFSLPLRQLASGRARRIARAICARPDIEELFDQTVEMVAASMNAEIVSLMLVDPDHGDLFIAASRGLEGQNLVGRRTTVRSGVAGSVAAWGRPLLVNNIETDRRFSRLNHPQYKTKSLLCVPLRVSGEVLGVLNVNNKISGESFDDDDLSVLSALVERVGSAVERASAHPESERVVEEALEAVRSVTRLRRDRLLGVRDQIHMARAIARELGMAESDVDLVGYVASIHDVGMTRIRDRVDQPGVLDNAGRDEVERHPEMSLEIMRGLEYQGIVRDLVLSHHERWDGSGYPRGLKGEEIPQGARILAVADAFESMIRGRPYRAALSREAALSELRRESGKQFDPAVIEAFAHVMVREGEGA